MTSNNPNWKRLNRETLIDEKFLTVYHDRVEVPSGQVRDYYLTKKSDIVIVVALTDKNEIVMLREYKYAADQYLDVLPAGHLEAGETPEGAARRELVEETGYEGTSYEYIGRLFEAPVQDLHRVEVVLVKGAKKTVKVQLEDTEDLTAYTISKDDIKRKVLQGGVGSCSTLGGLALSGILF